MTAALARGNWEIVEEQPDLVVAHGYFTHIGAAPAEYRLTFRSSAECKIASIEQHMVRKPVVPVTVKSPVIRRRNDRALADGNAIAVGYCYGDGRAVLSLRGSIRTWMIGR